MSQITVRCHPLAPVTSDDLQMRLTAEIERLRDDAPGAAIRLLRLSQAGPEGEITVGWQIELGTTLDDQSLGELLGDLRLLGLQPSVLQNEDPVTGGREFADPDAVGHASFPASDPPAVWNWEVERAGAVRQD
jgi:hypothetical protein